MKDFTVEMAWRRFEDMVVPASAEESQHRDMERAFYAGALEIFMAMKLLPRSGMGHEEQIVAIKNWEAELVTFCIDVISHKE